MHRSPNHPRRWLAPLAGALAIAAFPAAAGAATPTPTPCASPPAGNTPCYTAAPTVSPSSEWTNPPAGRFLTIPTTIATGTTTPVPGSWNPAPTSPLAPTYTYQWQDCDAATGLTCTDISGATSRTYTVASTDVGSKLQVVITAANSAGTGHAVLTSAGPAVTAAPIDRSAPIVSGPTQDGQTLTADHGTWGGTAPITYSYQWRRCDSAGKNCGAVFTTPSTSPTYVLQDADLGHTLSVVITATNSVSSTQQGSFPESAAITPGNTGAPSISGAAQEGNTLTESHGSWLPSNSTLGYQWETCDASGAGCSAIPGATSQAYKLTSSDVGHAVVVQETASQNGATSSPASSAPTGVVQAAPSGTGGAGGTGGMGGTGGTGKTGGGQGGGQPIPIGSSSAPAAVSAAQLRNTLTVRGNAARIRMLLKRGGYSFTFTAPSAGRLAISWYRVQHGRKILVATVNVLLHRTGTAKVQLILTRKGRNLLRRAGRTTLAAQGGFTPVGRGTTSASRTITLIR
jgi:hypothetical protein